MSDGRNNAGCGRVLLYLLLGGAGLWIGWQALQGLFYGLSYLGVNVLLALDLSVYGQLGPEHWLGYGLLGLGLGAAGGAIAARRRYQLAWPVAAAGWLFIAVLLVLVYATVFGAAPEAEAPPVASAARPRSAPRAGRPKPGHARKPAPDTSSRVASGEFRLARAASLWPARTDTLRAPATYLPAGDTVHLLRLGHGWARVAARPGQPVGWLRRPKRLLVALPARPAPASATSLPAPAEEDAPAPAAAADSAAKTARAWPLGTHQYQGSVGEQEAVFALDWRTGGGLSGSYYYRQQPGQRYRLVGAGQPDGALHLLEFARGQQTARCVLRPRPDGGYAGTMFTTDGRQLPMRLPRP